METLMCKCGSILNIDFDVETNEHFVECYENGCDYENSNISHEQLIRSCIKDGCHKGPY